MDQHAAFFKAVRQSDTSTLALLLERTPDLVHRAGEHGKTGLHWAAETDNADVARLLLEAGAEIEAETVWGATPLDWAATLGSSRVADVLLARGASGLTVIVAAALGKRDHVHRVMASGEDLAGHRRRGAPSVPNDHWPADCAHLLGDVVSDAMYAAARNGHEDIVAYLLDNGAAVDAKGVFGATALHWAALHGHQATVELLLARGASLSIRDARFNATPEEWARQGGHAWPRLHRR